MTAPTVGLHRSIGAITVLVALSGCDTPGKVLPGHTRPLLDHDWPHPRDLTLTETPFTPPDPSAARIVSSRGLVAFVVPAPSDALVRLTAVIPLGRLREAPGEEGAADLLLDLLTTGPELTNRLADLGATLDVERGLDLARISLEVLPEDWQSGLELLVGRLVDPRLDPAVIAGYRTGPGYDTPMAGIDGDGFRPKVELARRVLGYPLAPPAPGSGVSPGAVRALAARALDPGQVALGVGGPVVREEVARVIEAATRTWSAAPLDRPPPAPFEPRPIGPEVHLVDVPSLEGWIAIGRVIGPVPDADRAPLAAMAFILSERLNIAAREIRGLTNRDVLLLPETGSGAGLLHLRTGGRPEAIGPLIRFSTDELRRMYDPNVPISADELDRAKGWLVNGEWRGRLEDAARASTTLAVEQVRRGGTDHLTQWPAAVAAITAERVKAMAQRTLDPATMVTVVAGPLAVIRSARHPRWPIGIGDLVEK